jgi:hypothetical protein
MPIASVGIPNRRSARPAVRDIPAQSLAVSMAEQLQSHGNGSRQVTRSRSWPRPESSLPGRCPDAATNLIASKSLYTRDKDEWTEGFRYCRMRRGAVVPYAAGTSGQPLPYLPLPMARSGVPADEGRTALPVFQTGTRRQGVLCGSAPTLYSSQVQQQARIPAHFREPLRTNERLLTCASAAAHVSLPVSGGQGVAGSNPAVPTGQMGFSSLYSGANWGANGFPRAGLSQQLGLRLQDAVHGRCGLGERGPDLVPADRLGD